MAHKQKRSIDVAIGQAVRPTGKCFDDAIEFFEHVLRSDEESHAEKEAALRELRLVHGICLFPESNKPFAHAWVDDPRTDGVIQKGIFVVQGADVALYYELPRSDFVQRYRPIHATSYSAHAFARENARMGHYGPWVPAYIALCRDKKKPKR